MADKLQTGPNPDTASKERDAVSLVAPKLRRRECRFPVDTRATIYLLSLAARVTGSVVDISLGGCHVRTDNRFPVGVFRRVEAEFCVDGLPFRLGGVTQAIYDPFNVGIRFLDVSDRKRGQLLQLVQEIEEQKTGAMRSSGNAQRESHGSKDAS